MGEQEVNQPQLRRTFAALSEIRRRIALNVEVFRAFSQSGTGLAST
jgi:hypothetical protein